MPRTTRHAHKRLPTNQSALFGIKSFKRLAKILRTPEELLNKIGSATDNYMEFDLAGRWIETPKPVLKRIQVRIAYLLGQIETPEYLHSGVKKRSYITNAAGHSADLSTIKVDLKKFFPSARSAEVFRFLTEDLKWAPDVAGLGTKLLTIHGHLPTGGNVSPLLSFWAYKPLFDEVDRLSTENNCHFSLYVDDMSLSGEFASRKLMHTVRTSIGQHRLQAHKFHHFQKGQPKVITGVAQTTSGQKLPIKRQELIRKAELELRAATDDAEKIAILRPLIGRLCEAVEVDPASWKNKAAEHIQAARIIDRRRLRRGSFTPATLEIAEDSSVSQMHSAPWETPEPADQ